MVLEDLFKLNKTKKYLLIGLVGLKYTCGVMYVGDATDVTRDFYTPIRDVFLSTEKAEDFPKYSSTDIVSVVNEENKREVYLKVEGINGETVTPIKSDGRACVSLTEQVNNIIENGRESFEENFDYSELQELEDKAKLGLRYTIVRARRFLDKIF